MKLTYRTLLFAVVIMLLDVSVFAQTQQGYVKTKGRMVDGQHIPGKGLKGATVFVRGRTPILVDSEDGSFSFPMPDQQFHLESVTKKGYQLVDLETCQKTYFRSSSPIYIVMETPEQLLEDKLNTERKIRRNLQKQLQNKEDELEALREEEQISEEEYQKALQKLYSEQENNERIIGDMAQRYAELDYDLLDEFYRQVSYFIENGELTKADSLLRTRGNITQQVKDIQLRGQNLQEEKEQIEKVRAVQQADTEEAARHCKSLADKYQAQHQNDSAAYYLELRAQLDTTNIEWQYAAGEYIQVNSADYDKAFPYLQRALRLSEQQHGQDHPLTKAIITFINSSTKQQDND